MNTIIGELGKSPKFVSLVKNIENTKSPIEISGLTDVAETSIVAGINEFTKRPVLLVTYNEVQARKLAENIKYFTDKVHVFPKKEILTYDYVAESKDLPYERIDVLNKIYDNKNIIVVTTIEAIEQKILSKAELYKNTLNFEIGKRCNIDEIKQKLVDLGYIRYELIDARGEFSIRGGIIDISISDTTGVRIELWGDEVDSIRYFNIVSQRSTSQIDKIEIYPAHEFILEKPLEDVCNNIQSNVYEANKQQIVEKDIEEIKNGNYLSKVDRYFNSFYSDQETLLDYLDERYIVFVDEQNKIEVRSLNIKEDTERLVKALIEKEKIVPESLLNTATLEDTKVALDSKKVLYVEKLNTTTKSNIEKFNLRYRQLNYYKSGIDLFINDIKNFQKDKKKIYVVVDMKEKASKIEKLLNENKILARIEENLNQTIITKNTQNNVVITIGKLSEGFESYDLEQIVIVANELVEADRRKRKYKSEEFKQGEKVVFADLKVGDYVVHKNYGIGIYIGVNTITADGTTKDYIKLKYAGDDILYIPTDALDSIRKYVGGEDAGLKLNKLGSKDWEKTKTKVKNNLRAVAKELIELYARREKSRGHAFAPDTEWQKEFEGRFPYVETDDQLRCIEEVKTDMEKQKLQLEQLLKQ